MGVKRFLHVKLDVADIDRSVAFYCDLLGFEQVVRYDRNDGVTIVQVAAAGSPVGIELWREGDHVGLANDRLHVALEATDLVATVEQLRVTGVTIEREVFWIGHEQIAFIRDPDGYLIELNEIV
ncbi:VOC family protein [Roseibium aggregatum]|uniref:VOC family protein n=1 Tax=Roseibium aggregatum TaxID=187304 RepID=UPI0025AC3B7B|nr:VOC family protein [Roseibium aggregatum]WJS05559.1 VOC family protein [Roseibium aggregatum]